MNYKLKFNISYSDKVWTKKFLLPFSLYTEKIHYYYFIKFLNKERNLKQKKLLDFGMGDGKFCIFLSKKFGIETIGLDISEKLVSLYNSKVMKSKIKSKAILIKPGGKRLPFKDEFFDYVVCSHVLEHLPNDKIIIKEIYRVLKKTGFVYFNIPINETINVPTHLRKYNKNEFINFLMKSFFKPIFCLECDYFSYFISFLGVQNKFFYNILKRVLILCLTFIPIKLSEFIGKFFKLRESQFIAICKKLED